MCLWRLLTKEGGREGRRKRSRTCHGCSGHETRDGQEQGLQDKGEREGGRERGRKRSRTCQGCSGHKPRHGQ